MKDQLLICILLIFLNLFSLSAQEIERMEPPFWWAGMNNPELQLMVYGDQISKLKPSIDYPGVKIQKLHKSDNPNYLFIDLIIDPETQAGNLEIKFKSVFATVLTKRYELKTRDEASTNRSSFNGSDVMYLITPDRFANGDTSNDEVERMKEGLNRNVEFGRHGGDIRGLINHLDYFEEMGFTAIWLNPVLENDQADWSYHGYATTDYYNVDPRFGTNEEYIELSRKAKEKGIGIIMDIIVNHCGSEHWWMKDPPSSDWFNYQGEDYKETNHRKETLLDPYASSEDRERMVKGWFVKAMPDLNQRNPFLSTYLIQNTIWWIEYADLYGVRQDTYSYPFREFMTDWTCAIKSEYPNFKVVGEEWIDDPSVISYWQQGKVNTDGYSSCLASLMDFPLCFNLHKALNEEESWSDGMIRIYQSLSRDYLYADPSNLVVFPDNHDMSRIYTTLDEDYDLFKMAMVFVLTTRGIPQLYYGTEILMSHPGTTSHGMIRSDFPGGWEGDEINAFENRGLDSLSLEAKEFVKSLLNWRKSAEAIHNGELMHYVPQNGVYVYFRYTDDQIFMITMNKNDQEVELDLNRFKHFNVAEQQLNDVLSNHSHEPSDSLKLNAKSAEIYELK